MQLIKCAKKMGTIILKKKILESIKTDPTLYGKVAAALLVSPATLPRLIYANDARLTQASVLRVLRLYLGKRNHDLLTELKKSTAA